MNAKGFDVISLQEACLIRALRQRILTVHNAYPFLPEFSFEIPTKQLYEQMPTFFYCSALLKAVKRFINQYFAKRDEKLLARPSNFRLFQPRHYQGERRRA